MNIFSYHLIRLPLFTALKMMVFPPRAHKIEGLVHAETMSVMVLGSPIHSKTRIFNREVAVFAQWKEEKYLDDFLRVNSKGKLLAKGWHVRLEYLRKWGSISGYEIPAKTLGSINDDQPVVAVTMAKMKYTEIPRFLKWGRPAEKQVRDDKEATLALASIRYPNTISTFSIWKTQKAMLDMVHGRDGTSKIHRDAMLEHGRKGFHYEFTTLRFKPLSEFGEWEHQSNYIPN